MADATHSDSKAVCIDTKVSWVEPYLVGKVCDRPRAGRQADNQLT
jgi:hypothetical protein